MCGIFGIYSSKDLTENDISLVHTSKKYLDHRGPDEFNVKKINKNLVFSHSRLSIIDLSNENFQPRNDNEFVISFNGEIYNFKDLKKKYLRHENFLTNGDTEVLLKMWKKFGKNCPLIIFIFVKVTNKLSNTSKYEECELYILVYRVSSLGNDWRDWEKSRFRNPGIPPRKLLPG